IKNGSETGIDCGGTACTPCTVIGSGSTTNNGQLHAAYFETGWDGWDGGTLDTERYLGNYSWEGNYSIMIRDDSGDGSAMNSPAMDLRPFDKIKIEFAFYPNSMEKDEDFWLMYHDGIQWRTLKAYVSETDFFNNHFYEATFIVDRSQYAFVQNAKFRFQCDASTNADQVFIDAVRITGLLPGARDVAYSNKVESVGYYLGDDTNHGSIAINIFPNPTTDMVNILSQTEIQAFHIFDMNGRSMMHKSVEDTELTLDISPLPKGVYTLSLNTDGNIISKKIIKN
ncbi:MAG: T9SS type A sorting domain-containing protein, partial [Saprospiraceae bacterium]